MKVATLNPVDTLMTSSRSNMWNDLFDLLSTTEDEEWDFKQDIELNIRNDLAPLKSDYNPVALFEDNAFVFSDNTLSLSIPQNTVNTMTEIKLKPLKRKREKQSTEEQPIIGSPHKGVCWYKRTKKWVVQVQTPGSTRRHIGYFSDSEDAIQAYLRATQKN